MLFFDSSVVGLLPSRPCFLLVRIFARYGVEPQIEVIDDDLGKSGTSSQERDELCSQYRYQNF